MYRALGEEIAALYTHMHTEVAAAYSADTAELNSLLMQRERMLRRYEDFQVLWTTFFNVEHLIDSFAASKNMTFHKP